MKSLASRSESSGSGSWRIGFNEVLLAAVSRMGKQIPLCLRFSQKANHQPGSDEGNIIVESTASFRVRDRPEFDSGPITGN